MTVPACCSWLSEDDRRGDTFTLFPAVETHSVDVKRLVSETVSESTGPDICTKVERQCPHSPRPNNTLKPRHNLTVIKPALSTKDRA